MGVQFLLLRLWVSSFSQFLPSFSVQFLLVSPSVSPHLKPHVAEVTDTAAKGVPVWPRRRGWRQSAQVRRGRPCAGLDALTICAGHEAVLKGKRGISQSCRISQNPQIPRWLQLAPAMEPYSLGQRMNQISQCGYPQGKRGDKGAKNCHLNSPFRIREVRLGHSESPAATVRWT